MQIQGVFRNIIDGPIGGNTASATQTVVSATNSPSSDVSGAKTLAVQVSVTSVTAPANTTWTSGNVSGNNITITAHGYKTGTACTLTTTVGLPTGLATSTTYYLIAIDVNTVAFGSSLANALAGTAITLSSSGSGTGTVNITALASCTAQLFKSMDGTIWYSEGATQSISAIGGLLFTKVDPECRSYRIQYAIASGQIAAVVTILGKGQVA